MPPTKPDRSREAYWDAGASSFGDGSQAPQVVRAEGAFNPLEEPETEIRGRRAETEAKAIGITILLA